MGVACCLLVISAISYSVGESSAIISVLECYLAVFGVAFV